MSRESKILNARVHNAEKTIQHYESFGWELLSLNGSQITMSRETQNPVYPDLVKSQAKYESLLEQYAAVRNPIAPAKPADFSLGTCFVLLLLAVVPGALYIAYKVKKNNDYKAQLNEYSSAMRAADNKRSALIAEMERVALDSRANFFGKQG